MAKTKKTSPATPQATRRFRVYATDVLFQDVEAVSADEAHDIAEEDPCFEPCGGFLQIEPDVKDLDADTYIRVGAPTSPCKTCGSEIVATVNDGAFRDGECNGCEYERYRSQPQLLAAVREAADCLNELPRTRLTDGRTSYDVAARLGRLLREVQDHAR